LKLHAIQGKTIQQRANEYSNSWYQNGNSLFTLKNPGTASSTASSPRRTLTSAICELPSDMAAQGKAALNFIKRHSWATTSSHAAATPVAKDDCDRVFDDDFDIESVQQVKKAAARSFSKIYHNTHNS
jgi:hypothetical protein